MTKGYIFDYGGTLDTAGCHWGKKLWHAYERHEVPVSEQQFREAYVHAERTLGSNPIIQPTYTFHKLLEVKLRLELEYLMEQGYWDPREDVLKMVFKELLDDLYGEVCATVAHSREVLLRLRKDHPMVLVSNFYGNINVVLREFELDTLFDSVVESAVVGIRLPAKKAGCRTIWFKGEGWTDETYDESIPDQVITDLSQVINELT